MSTKQYTFTYQTFDSSEDLSSEDSFLLSEARSVTNFAYAPYSNFNVGAAARLKNGEIVTGTNQENAAYPAGLCAERVLLSTAASLFPGVAIDAMAISYHNLKGSSDKPASPCGICRQTLTEFQHRTHASMRLILSGLRGPVQVIDDAEQLLPFSFGSGDLV